MLSLSSPSSCRCVKKKPYEAFLRKNLIFFLQRIRPRYAEWYCRVFTQHPVIFSIPIGAKSIRKRYRIGVLQGLEYRGRRSVSIAPSA